MPHRIAFVTSHPIQYQIPVFRELARRQEVELEVLFAHLPDEKEQGDGFGVDFTWDIPLLEGYPYRILNNVARVPSVTRFSGCDTPEIAQLIGDGGFDAVIVNGWVVKTCLQALRACRRSGTPCLVRGEANHLRPRPWWKKILQKSLVRRFSAHLYIGEANRQFYESYGVRPGQLFPARYCVENDRFTQAALDEELRHSTRKRYGIPNERVCFLFSGKFEPKKHPMELVRAFGDAVQRGTKSFLLMLGDGPLRKNCEQLARQSDLPIHFAGFVNQSKMPAAYSAGDCLILPSDHGETWGLVVNEMMSCARPAITSDQVGCSQDLIIDGETGFTFPFGDWRKLSDLIATCSDHPNQLDEMGKRASKCIQSYSPRAAAEGILQAVEWVTSNRSS